MAITNEDLINRLKRERTASLGFDDGLNGYQLLDSRLTAQLYLKGDMNRDMPVPENTSGAVDSVLSDTVKQLKPMISAIFRDENVVSFVARTEADVDAAQVETDYMNWIIFEDNNGYDLMNTVSHDAFTMKNAFLYYYWDKPEEPESYDYKNMGELDYGVAKLLANPQLDPNNPQQTKPKVAMSNVKQNKDGSWNYTLADPTPEGRVCIKAWAPHHVAVNIHATCVEDARYMVFRSFQTRQDLLKEGYNLDDVLSLSVTNRQFNQMLENAIDRAGESLQTVDGATDVYSETVEVLYHYVRVWEQDEGKETLYFCVTGGATNASILLKREEVQFIPCASFCAWPVPHRFYGESLADILAEPMRQKTALTRLMMNASYYAQNGRYEVAESGATKYTMKDIVRNIPNSPVRVKTTGTVNLLPTNNDANNYLEQLEYIATRVEQKTGVMRSAMGMGSDAMHDTKGGMLAMMDQGKVRVREVAVNFCETGFKDMVRGIHRTVRENASMAQEFQIGGKFVQVDPTTWDERKSLRTEIANDGGRDMDMARYNNILQIHEQLGKGQGGPVGPLTNPTVVLEAATRLVRAAGVKDAASVMLPAQSYQPPPPQPPKPDPEMVKAQNQAQNDQQQLALEAQKHSDNIALESKKHDDNLALKQQIATQELQLKQYEIQFNAAHKANQLQEEVTLKRQIEELKAQLAQEQMHLGAQVDGAKIAVDAHLQTEQMAHDQFNNLAGLAIDHASATASHSLDVQKHNDSKISLGTEQLGGDPGS